MGSKTKSNGSFWYGLAFIIILIVCVVGYFAWNKRPMPDERPEVEPEELVCINKTFVDRECLEYGDFVNVTGKRDVYDKELWIYRYSIWHDEYAIYDLYDRYDSDKISIDYDVLDYEEHDIDLIKEECYNRVAKLDLDTYYRIYDWKYENETKKLFCWAEEQVDPLFVFYNVEEPRIKPFDENRVVIQCENIFGRESVCHINNENEHWDVLVNIVYTVEETREEPPCLNEKVERTIVEVCE